MMPHLLRTLRLAFLVAALPAFMPVAAKAEENASKLGREVFLERAEPKCGICHALAHAGTSGDIGPNLDDLRPSEEQVKAAVSQGIEAMPAYAERLSQDEIDAVAKYVAAVAGQQ